MAIANWIGTALRVERHLVSRFLFYFAAALFAFAAFLRTWASSYLRAEVVYATGVKTESLVADGLMSRIGFTVAMLATVVFCYRLILRGEAELGAIRGTPY